jgi:hypothetical protein
MIVGGIDDPHAAFAKKALDRITSDRFTHCWPG